MVDIPYVVIGGGVVGSAIALQIRRGGQQVALVEACPQNRMENQSTRNSGVIHAGIYYCPETQARKARLCVAGNALLYEFCQEYGVSHAQTGKLVVACNARQEEFLDPLYERARENQVPKVSLIDGEQAMAMEPGVRASKALLVPSSGIVDAAGYLKTLQSLGAKAGVHILFAAEVIAIAPAGPGFAIRLLRDGKEETFVAGKIINAAGLYADAIANMVNEENTFRIVPVRGEAAKFYKSRRSELAMVGMNVYPVPSAFYTDTGAKAEVSLRSFQALLKKGEIAPTTGVHLSPTLDGSGGISEMVTIGPAVQTGFEKDDLHSRLYPPQYYHSRVCEFFPGLSVADISLHQSGQQARLAGRADWIIERDSKAPGCIHLIGIDSPGLSASLAIAQEVLSMLD